MKQQQDTSSKQDREQAWRMENAAAIKAYNQDVEKNGVFSDGRRLF